MSTHLIELSDPSLTVNADAGQLIASPAFVNIAGNRPVFGQPAQQQSRLHPRQTFNQFWAQLSLDPLANTNQFFRHQADLAYGHLNNLASECELNSEVVFAIPGHFSRNQLAILLGLTRQSTFTAAGMVDLGLLAAATHQIADRAVYLDLQLHQSVLTLIRREDGLLVRDRVLQIPGAGLLALQDAWASMITDAFVKQARFNPLHNAETEQYLYNQLQGWLSSAMAGNEVLLDINYKGNVHQATANRGYFEQKARNILQQIAEEIKALGGEESQLLLTDRASALPGVSLYLPPHDRVPDDIIAANGFRFLDQIRGDPEALSFITRLPAPDTSGTRRQAKAAAPTRFVLIGHKAYALPSAGEYSLLGVGADTPASPHLQSDRLPDRARIALTQNEGSLSLTEAPAGLMINGKEASAPQILQPGDRLALANSELELLIIEAG